MQRGSKDPLALGALSLAGMVAAHVLSYLVTTPGHVHRDDLLEATGHDPGISFTLIAFALAVGGLAALVGSGASERQPAITWRRLAGLQVGAFVALETWERTTVHVSFDELLTEPVFVSGLLIQLLVAAFGAWFAGAFQRAVSALILTRRRGRRAPSNVYSSGSRTPRRRFVASGPWCLRDPPPATS